MYRIDENIYIDDSLVTCAEYQLFIDEMREQGKYRQPDHWISYQFPAGQSQEPILGVRHSDTIEFCEWLTIREKGGWKYRLPISNEAVEFPLKPYKEALMGYWLNDEFEFAWIDPEQDKSEKARVEKNIPSERQGYSARTRAIIIDSAAYKPRSNKISDAVLDEYKIAIDNIRRRDLDRNDNIKRVVQLLSNLSDYESFTSVELFQEDILILRERIAGRYPPYEGVRLVKVKT